MKVMIDELRISRKIFTQSSRQVTDHLSYRVAVTDFGSFRIYEYTLAPGELLWLKPMNGLVLPVSGSIEFDHVLLNPGEASRYVAKESEVFNPYEKELVNFLVIESSQWTQPEAAGLELFSFDINSSYNSTVRICQGISIGKFSGRKDFSYQKSLPGDGIMIYVIEGAFEVAECLLEDRDGLLVKGSTGCEWEALSNNAIILIAELT